MAAKRGNVKKHATKKATTKKLSTKEPKEKLAVGEKIATTKENMPIACESETPRKIGRPTADPKVKRIDIRLTQSDWEFLDEYCKKMGVSKPQALRDGVKLLHNKE